jgi:hypothetical protein
MGRYQIDCSGSDFNVQPSLDGGEWAEGYGVRSATAPERGLEVVRRD